MKILIFGDFHGKFPEKLKQRIKRENPDLILSPGDFCGNQKLSKMFFKYAYGKKEDEIPNKIKNEMDRLEKVSVNSGINLVKNLRKLNVPFYAVRGNWDPSHWEYDIGAKEVKHHQFGLKRFDKQFGKDFQLVDFECKEFDDFVLVGGTSTTSPGKADKKVFEKLKEVFGIKKAHKEIARRKKHLEKRRKRYENAFRLALKMKKPIIFLTHNCPYNTRLDRIGKGPQKGKHYGSWLEKEMIKKYKPSLVICGHMHENFGKDKIGKTLVINSGSVLQDEFVIVEYPVKNRDIKVKFAK